MLKHGSTQNGLKKKKKRERKKEIEEVCVYAVEMTVCHLRAKQTIEFFFPAESPSFCWLYQLKAIGLWSSCLKL
jgi:hypothetical protein